MSDLVHVLMSTFNGEAFIADQIHSVYQQEFTPLKLTIRDDGSYDNTCKRIRTLISDRNHVSLIEGHNVGVFKSFMELLDTAGDEGQYYAFCDQDDYWLPDKITRAVKALKTLPEAEPGLYYCRLEFTDASLRPTGFSIIPTQSGFHTALVQNQATGCTIVMNRKARELLLESVPDWALMHDWWCYLVVSAFGTVIYDVKPGIKYRKHHHNVTPASPYFAVELLNRIRRFLNDHRITKRVTDQALEFKKRYGHKLSAEKSAILDGFIKARSRGIFGRLLYAVTMPLRRNTPFDTLIMRVLIVFGRF